MLEKRISRRILSEAQDNLSTITPGLRVCAYHRGRKKIDLALGKTYKYYDLASLTKIIFTTSLYMQMVSEKKIKLNSTVSQLWPSWRHKTTKLVDLLSHHGGLPWWLPMYKALKGPMEPEKRWHQVEKKLLKIKPQRPENSVYSDVDMWVLGAAVCHYNDKPLHDLWLELSENWQTPGLHFNPKNKPKYARKKYAPTEKCPWRKKTLRGEVHDDNTWSMGGVAPHAGLFGSLEDVAWWGLQLRKGFLEPEGSLIGSHKTIHQCVSRKIPRAKGDWAAGFMLPTKGSASCGRYFSLRSFGHTGFTGTSLWFDPSHDLLVILLSNRVHPTRDNPRFAPLRPKIHNIIFEELLCS